MAMTTGSVTIDENGDPSGSGCARELYDDYVPKLGIPVGTTGAASKQQIADLCNSLAKIVDHVKTNAEVTVKVSTSDTELQRMPASTAENTPTKGPNVLKTLSTKGTVG